MLVCIALPETNIAPQNRPSQKEISIPTIHFHVLCGYVSFREGMCIVWITTHPCCWTVPDGQVETVT